MKQEWISKSEIVKRLKMAGVQNADKAIGVRISEMTRRLRLNKDYTYNEPRRSVYYRTELFQVFLDHFKRTKK